MDCDFFYKKNLFQPLPSVILIHLRKGKEKMLNNQNKLSHNERYLIDILFNQEQKSISEIAKTLKRSKSTISVNWKEIPLMVFMITM